MEKRYRVLRIIGTIYKILGIIAAVLTVIGSIGICVTAFLGGPMMTQFQGRLGAAPRVSSLVGATAAGVIAAVIVLIYGAITTLLLYGFGEGIYLVIAIEENTRITAAYLQQYSTEAQPPTEIA